MINSIFKFQRFPNFIQRFISSDSGNAVRRSVLYVPASDEKKLEKAKLFTKCDSIIIDLEDGVNLNSKDRARQNAARFLDQISTISLQSEFGLRINSRGSIFSESDIKCCFAKVQPKLLMFPKVTNLGDIAWLEDQLSQMQKSNHHLSGSIPTIIMTESAMGLLNLKDILEYCSKNKKYIDVNTVLFGSDDFLVSIGVARSNDNRCLDLARQQVVIHAKAYNLGAIDMVNTDFHDLEKLKKDSVYSYEMGFTGKQLIHPSQIPIVNESYSPSSKQMEWAKNILELYEANKSTNKGAFVYEEKMIDQPLIEQARNIAKYIGKN